MARSKASRARLEERKHMGIREGEVLGRFDLTDDEFKIWQEYRYDTKALCAAILNMRRWGPGAK